MALQSQRDGASAPISPYLLVGMLLSAMAILVLQVLLTRILSMSVSHHSSFVVIAMVMMGMAAAAVAVFKEQQKPDSALPQKMIRAAYLAGLSTVIAYLIYAHLILALGARAQQVQLIMAAILFFPASYLSGYLISALLTHYAEHVSMLYWFDLTGAALGCAVVVPLLDVISAPVLIVLTGALFALAGTLIAWHGKSASNTQWRAGAALTVALAAFAGAAMAEPSLVRMRSAKGVDSRLALWEHWNSLATVTVYPENPNVAEAVRAYRSRTGDDSVSEEELRRIWQMGWGPSKTFKGFVPDQHYMVLDGAASTAIVAKTADEKKDLEFLRWDVTAIGYWLRPKGVDRALVIGGGGGRDILTALVSGARDVDVLELNPDVVNAVEGPFAEFAGPIYSRPNVHLELGEARAVLSRRDQKYDMIQMSMVDAFAASMNGSLVLSEQFLYTRDAFRLFLSRLTPEGIMSTSRWCWPGCYAEPGLVLRMAVDAYENEGVKDASNHLVVIENRGYLATAIITVLAKKTPYTPEELKTVSELCKTMDFKLRWPVIEGVTEPCELDIAGILAGKTDLAGMEEFDMRTPTDDLPFIFNYHRPFRSWAKAIAARDPKLGSQLTLLMVGLLALLSLVGYSLVIRPLRTLARERSSGSTVGQIAYFSGIGMGFMLVELALIQSLMLFLGHPTYSITVVLFSLLLFSGLGSGLTNLMPAPQSVKWPLVLIVLGSLAWLGAPRLLETAYTWSMPARVALSVALVAPLALCMGTVFPMGVRQLTQTNQQWLVPWMWGINGLMSVYASVLGMWLATMFGFSLLFVLAAVSYAMPLVVAFAWTDKPSPGLGSGRETTGKSAPAAQAT